MRTLAAVLVGSSVLAIATLAGKASAQTRWPISGSYVPAPAASPYYQNGPFYYPYYYRPAPVRPDADRGKVEKPAPRPARTTEIVYLNAEGGYESLSLSTLTAVGSVATGDIRPVSVSTTGSGAFYGVGGGFRFAFLTLGGRVRGAHLNVGSLQTIDGELGARISLYRVEPYFTFGAGYAKLAATGSEVAGIPDLDIHGWNARAGLGLDYYADKNVTIGANFTGDVLAMARPGVDLSTSPEAQTKARVSECQAMSDPSQQTQCANNVVHDTQGASAGFAGSMAIVMGLHF
jgi:hypothetical protein